jgi:hypothetical protein
MEEIELPFLPPETGLGDAIEALRASGRHALVTRTGDKPFVLRAGDLTERWNALQEEGRDPAATQLGEVVPRAVAPRPPSSVAGTASVDLSAGGFARAQIEQLFAATDARHVVRAVLGGVAKVVTASERFAGTLLNGRNAGTGALAGIVRCAGEPVHYFVSSELKDPARCNFLHRKPIIR